MATEDPFRTVGSPCVSSWNAREPEAGRVGGLLEGLPEDLGTEAVLDLMIAEAVRSSAIEGETLNPDAVRSSIRNRLGLNAMPQPVDSRMAGGWSWRIDGRRPQRFPGTSFRSYPLLLAPDAA